MRSEIVLRKALEVSRYYVGRDGDVVVAVVTGLYGPQVHRDVREGVADEIEMEPARAVLADLRGAVSIFSDEGRRQAVSESVDADRQILLPIAMVVSEPLLAPTRSMCARAWQYGRQWVTFVDYEDALSWARSRRPHWRQTSAFAPLLR